MRLESELLEAREDARTARAERDAAHAELANWSREQAAQRSRERAAQERAALPPPGQTAELAALRERLASAEAEREKAVDEAGAARDQTSRARKRAENLDKVYVILRGEHALQRDELRSQREELERLRALKVAVIDPLPDDAGERPYNGHLKETP